MKTGLRKAQRDTKGKTQTRQMSEQKNTDSDTRCLASLIQQKVKLYALLEV